METRAARSLDRPRARAAAAVVLSAALNAAALVALAGAGAFRLGSPQRPPAQVALARLGAGAWEEHRRIAGEPPARSDRREERPPPAAAQPPRPREQPAPEGLLVRVAPSPDTRRPERARFLAERDGSVERETRYRGAVAHSGALAPRPTAGAAGSQGVPSPGEQGRAEESAPGREGEAAPERALERVEAARRVVAAADGEQVRAAAVVAALAGSGGGEGGARRGGRFDPRILPVGTGFAAPGGGAPTNDFLPGVAEGDATLVNTRAFRFAAFFRRVHDAIAGEWKPNRAWDARDPQDRLLGRTTRSVQVDLLLDDEGRLREARLVRGSGLEFFDAEALRAIRDAAPFPNPPRGLVGPDGIVALRGWRLVFEFGPEAILDRWLPGR